jgi:hypothetical protein
MTLAVVVATEPLGEGATAGLPYAADVTVLDRLLSQLGSLGIGDVRIITRPDLAQSLRKNGHEVIESDGLADDLRQIAAIARSAEAADSAGTPLLVLHGDLVANDELLLRLESGAKSPAAAVTGPFARSLLQNEPTRPLVRVGRHLVDSAGTRYHQVTAPTGVFLGALRVAPETLPSLASAADGLATATLTETTPVGTGTGEVGEALEVYVDNDVDGALGGKGRRVPLPPALGATPPAGDDVVALLLTGLVRSGVRVTAREAGPLVCERVLTPDEVAAGRQAVESVNEDRVRLEAAVKSDDGFFTTYAVSSYSAHVAKVCARLRLTPNMVTSISMAIAVVSAVWFSAGTRTGQILGAILLYLAFLFDCVDGQLARYTRQFSTLGAWLDATFDRAKEYTVYAGLAVGSTAAASGSAVHGGDVWPLAVAALTVQTVRHMIDFSFSAAKQDAPPAPRPTLPLTGPSDSWRPPARPRARGAAGLGRLVMVVSSRTERIPGLHWAKKIVILPIGERFALIALTAAIWNAKVTFLSLLVWGSLAALYTLTGRVLRSLAR